MYNWSVIHGIKRKLHLSVVWNWYHFVAIAILHQPRPTDSADINTRLQLSDTSSIPPMHGGFLLVSHSWKLWVVMMPTLSSLVPVMTKLASWWFSLSSGYMLYWHGMIVPVPVKCYWWIWKRLFNTRPYSKQNTNRVCNSWDIQCNTENKISYDHFVKLHSKYIKHLAWIKWSSFADVISKCIFLMISEIFCFKFYWNVFLGVWLAFRSALVQLTHSVLVTPYSNIDLSQHWLR